MHEIRALYFEHAPFSKISELNRTDLFATKPYHARCLFFDPKTDVTLFFSPEMVFKKKK